MSTRTFEQRLKEAREAAGLSQVDVAFEARVKLPEPMWISQVKVSRLEGGKIGEDKADPHDIQFLAHLYGVTTSELSELAAERLESFADFLSDRGIAEIPCFGNSLGRELADVA